VSGGELTTEQLQSADIEALTIWCKEAHEQSVFSIETAFTKTIRFGKLLSAVREKIPHGQWIPWVNETFGDSISLRKIQQCIQVACEYAQNPAHLGYCETLDSAMSVIAVKKQSQPEMYDAPIEVTAREPEPERRPSVSVKKPAKQKPVKSFFLDEQLDQDRETILERAAEYFEHEETEKFLTLLRNLIKQIQSEMLEAKR
jgi:hypothetical protein